MLSNNLGTFVNISRSLHQKTFSLYFFCFKLLYSDSVLPTSTVMESSYELQSKFKIFNVKFQRCYFQNNFLRFKRTAREFSVKVKDSSAD